MNTKPILDNIEYFYNIINLYSIPVPIIFVSSTAVLIFIYFYIIRINKQKTDRFIALLEDFSSFKKHQTFRKSSKDESYGEKIIQELFQDNARIDAKINDLLNKVNEITHIHAVTNKKDESIVTIPNENFEHSIAAENLMRDISHSLNTPLSKIEISASLLHNNKEDIEKTIKSIIDSIQLCKTIISAYREIIISHPAKTWNPSSISETINAAAKSYSEIKNKKFNLINNLPDSIDGYSNNYISALILPVLENAIESNKNGSSIAIGFDKKHDQYILLIDNEPETPPGGNEIYNQGFTTKSRHEGTGLSSVKHLLNAYQGSSISHSSKSHHTTFTITLPGRIK
jgi:signal transduction histidine kinase